MESNDSNLIQQIYSVLNQLTSPDVDVQTQNFALLQEIQQNFPYFCFYLLHIISESVFPSNLKFLALIVLHRNHKNISDELIPAFLEQSKPIMIQLLQSNKESARFASAIISSQIKLYGPDTYPEFMSIIISHLQNPTMISCGLECIHELSLSNMHIPREVLDLFPSLIATEHGAKVLQICKKIYENNENFINQFIIPIIAEQYEDFSEEALQEAASLATVSFCKTGDDLIGEFISLCILSNKYELANAVVFELNEHENFNPYPKLIIALMHIMEAPDQDYTTFEVVSCAQLVLQDISYLYEEVSEIVKENLEQCSDVGHYLRCLYSILSRDFQSMEFLPIILEHMSDEYRAEASMCLMSICYSNDSFVDQAISLILPLLADQDPRTQYYAMYSLQILLHDFKFTPILEHFAFLIEVMKSSQQDTIIDSTELVSLYALKIKSLDKSDFLVSFAHELIDFFLSMNDDHMLFTGYTTILTAMIHKTDFDLIIYQILQKCCLLLDIDDDNILSVTIQLVIEIISLFPSDFDENEEIIIFSRKMILLTQDQENTIILELIFKYMRILSQNITSVFNLDAEEWLNVSIPNLSCTNVKISALIAETWMNLIPNIRIEFSSEFLHRSYLINNFKSEITSDTETIKQLALTIIIFMLENNIPIDEDIKKFYDDV